MDPLDRIRSLQTERDDLLAKIANASSKPRRNDELVDEWWRRIAKIDMEILELRKIWTQDSTPVAYADYYPAYDAWPGYYGWGGWWGRGGPRRRFPHGGSSWPHGGHGGHGGRGGGGRGGRGGGRGGRGHMVDGPNTEHMYSPQHHSGYGHNPLHSLNTEFGTPKRGGLCSDDPDSWSDYNYRAPSLNVPIGSQSDIKEHMIERPDPFLNSLVPPPYPMPQQIIMGTPVDTDIYWKSRVMHHDFVESHPWLHD